jgi:undecaprenyl-diphosphatase
MAKLTIAAIQVRLALIFLAVGVPGLLAAIAKRLIGRIRPPAFETHGHLAFEPIGWKAIAQGFPSGHATTAFAAAVVLGMLWPRARVPLYVLAGLIALSRVVLGSHYPSDAIAGAMFGTVAAALVVRAFAKRRLAVKVSAAGRVEAMAGPSLARLIALAGSIRAALRRRGQRPGKRAADESLRG